MTFKTEQEAFWAGDFRKEYSKRNRGDALLATNLRFFSRALRAAAAPKTCIEFGDNIGMNLKALKLLYPEMEMHAIEINDEAACELAEVIGGGQIFRESILQWSPPETLQWELALVKGVLIHIPPDELPRVYDKLVASTIRWLLLAEYYNPTPVSVPYRGHTDRLFKRDFAGEILERHQEMHLRDYGFVYRRDPVAPQDDVTWFLLEKVPGRTSDSVCR